MHSRQRVLIALELIIGANAVYGGIGLARDGLGMPDDWLTGTPFDSWLWPGVFLLLVVAVPMVVAAAAEIWRRAWAYRASGVAAGLLLGWIIVQLAVLQRYFSLQPVLFAAGLAVAALAIWTHHREPLVMSSDGAGREG
jgi:hypothetical protein